MAKKTIFVIYGIFAAAIFLTGCAILRHAVIPQERKGPHEGALTFIDQRVPEYIEFVAIPGDPEWTFQVYVYDKNLKQRSICGSGYLTIKLRDGKVKEADLWDTKPYSWSKGIGFLENKMKLNNEKEFLAIIKIFRGRSVERLEFKYPY